VDQGEKPVLVFGFAAADLVDQDRLGPPDGGRRFQEFDAARFRVRVGEADQVVEGNQAGVVVPVLQPQGFAERVEQKRLAGPRRPDEQQRVAGDKRGEDDGLVLVETVDIERLQISLVRGFGAHGQTPF
jgi:hypothetical protein